MRQRITGGRVKGIRWIVGLPLGYAAYSVIVWFNEWLIILFSGFAKFLPVWIFQLEATLVNGTVAVYIGIGVSYFMLPSDNFALVNNTKVKIIYWVNSVLTILILINAGFLIYQAIHGELEGAIFQFIYIPLMIITIWVTQNAISAVDFNHNKPYRDYIEQAVASEL